MAVGGATSTLAEPLPAYYDRLLIEREKPYLRLSQFAQKRPLPAHAGKTIYFKGYRPGVRPTSALGETSGATAKYYAARELSATIAEWGATYKMSKLLSMTKIDPGMEEQIDIVAIEAAETIEYQLAKLIAKQGIWGISKVDRTTNHRTITVSSSTSNSTTLFQTTAATSCNAVSGATTFTGAIVTVLKDGLTASGSTVKWGWAGRVSSVSFSTTAGDKFKVQTAAPCTAAPEAFQSSDRIRICSISNIASTDNIANTEFAMAQRDLKINHAVPFGDGYYGSAIPAAIAYSLKLDSTWVSAASYSNITELYKGEIGRWYGTRVVESTIAYRETTAGVEGVDSGGVYHSYFMGRNAFGHTDLAGGGRKIHVVQGPDTNEPIPRNVYVSWYHPYAQKALSAPWCVSVAAGAAA